MKWYWEDTQGQGVFMNAVVIINTLDRKIELFLLATSVALSTTVAYHAGAHSLIFCMMVRITV